VARRARTRRSTHEGFVTVVLALLVGAVVLGVGVIVVAFGWALRDGSRSELRRRDAVDRELRDLLDTGGRP
jgi:hypothetical protein